MIYNLYVGIIWSLPQLPTTGPGPALAETAEAEKSPCPLAPKHGADELTPPPVLVNRLDRLKRSGNQLLVVT